MGVTFSALNLQIGDTGGDQTIKKLDAIDQRVSKMSETSRAAFAAMSKQEQEAFLRWESGARAATVATDQATASVVRATVATENLGTATTTMNTRAARATQGISRGFEMVMRTGNLTGRSLDQVLSNVSQLALGFGQTGLLVGAVGIATAAIVELFNRTRKELEKTQTEFSQRLVEMAHASNLAGLAGRFGSATQLKSGDEAMRTLGRKAFPQLSDVEFLKQSGGIEGLTAERDRLQAKVNANPSIYRQGSKDADQLREVIKALTEAQTEYNNALKITDIVTKRVTAENEEGDKRKGEKNEQKTETEFERRLNHLKSEIDSFGKELDTAERSSLERSVHSQVEAVTQGAEEIHRAIMKQNEESAKAFESFLKALDRQWTELQNRIQRQAEVIAGRIAGVMDNVFMAAFAPHGGIKKAFQALTAALLEGLGEMFEKAGEKALLGVALIQKIATAISEFDGPTGIAAGLALVALGAALKGAGSRAGSASPGGGGGGGYYAAAPLGGTIVVNPSGASAASPIAGMQARPQINLYATIFGKHDSGAQRELLDMIDLAQRRKT